MKDETVRQILKKQLVIDEGWKKKLYRDSMGIWSLGCGRNVADKGLSDIEIEMLLNNDIDQAYIDVQAIYGDVFFTFSEGRQAALLNMAFNLGQTKLRGFHGMNEAVKKGDWESAADHAKNSLWAKQVKQRAVRIIHALRTGIWVNVS